MIDANVDWVPIKDVPEGVEVLVTGGISIMGGRPLGRRVAVIDDRADLYRQDNGQLRATSPTMWTILPPEPIAKATA